MGTGNQTKGEWAVREAGGGGGAGQSHGEMRKQQVDFSWDLNKQVSSIIWPLLLQCRAGLYLHSGVQCLPFAACLPDFLQDWRSLRRAPQRSGLLGVGGHPDLSMLSCPLAWAQPSCRGRYLMDSLPQFLLPASCIPALCLLLSL